MIGPGGSLRAVALAASLAVAGCARPSSSGATMRVELDVFSGRPNPSWHLSPAEIAGLKARLAGLPRCGQPVSEPALGYRGFVLSNPQAAHGLPPLIRVHDGAVAIRTEAGAECYTDSNGVESWLLDLARTRGHGALLRELGK